MKKIIKGTIEQGYCRDYMFDFEIIPNNENITEKELEELNNKISDAISDWRIARFSNSEEIKNSIQEIVGDFGKVEWCSDIYENDQEPESEPYILEMEIEEKKES
jgi:hypothetical protein